MENVRFSISSLDFSSFDESNKIVNLNYISNFSIESSNLKNFPNNYTLDNFNEFTEKKFINKSNSSAKNNESDIFSNYSSLQANKNSSLKNDNYWINFTKSLLLKIKNDDFSYGYSSQSEDFVDSHLHDYKLQVLDCINSIYLENFKNKSIIFGLLHILSHMEYQSVQPQGPIIAMASLSHEDLEVREAAIRAFENWGSAETLDYLESVQVAPEWLQSYLENVIDSLK